jgi:hypothetical protein
MEPQNKGNGYGEFNRPEVEGIHLDEEQNDGHSENIETSLDDIENLEYLTGGYSPESHRETLEKLRKERRERNSLEEKASDYWNETDKEVAKAMKIEPSPALVPVYNLLSSIGINLYKRDARRAIRKITREAKKIKSDVGKFYSRLEGRTEYISPHICHDEKAAEPRKYVRDSDKGLRYKHAEALDEARILGYQYRNGMKALDKYRRKMASIDEDISALQSAADDRTADARLSNQQSEKSVILREKESIEQAQREYAQELVMYDKKIDRLQAKISFYEHMVRRGDKNIVQLEGAVDVLDDYIRERDGLLSVNELIRDLSKLDLKHDEIRKTIDIYDERVRLKLSELSETLEPNHQEYNDRPLIRDIAQMGIKDEVKMQKDMGRILGKLNIPV